MQDKRHISHRAEVTIQLEVPKSTNVFLTGVSGNPDNSESDRKEIGLTNCK
ncbi:hypothetical protein Fmac_020271 [Flemingia macrophylla]|uniref:Uncharacterized protein n=1 Tax=Flemingia macrophylla TaxID=520843 RepID=A0ABD1LTJ6_9FABA